MLVLEGAEDVVAIPENGKRLAAEYPGRVTLVEISKRPMQCRRSNRSKLLKPF
jgi:hypothetical protein